MPENETDVVGFFNEDHESRSMMRLMCFICMWASFVVGAFVLIMAAVSPDNNQLLQYGFMMFGSLLGAAFTGKIIQKFGETK